MDNKTKLILSFYFLINIITVSIIDKIPCMEPNYLNQGINILKIEKTDINLSPLYSILIASLFNLTESLLIATSLTFVFFSTLMAYFVYKFTELNYGKGPGIIALILLFFFPISSVSIIGYSHSVIVSAAFLFGFIYFISNFRISLNNKYLLASFIFALVSVLTRPETLFVIFLVIIYNLFSLIISKQKLKGGLLISFMIFGISSGLMLHKELVKSASQEQNNIGVFTKSKYSYMTFIHTYSMRYANAIDDELAIKYSEAHIGTPESNNFSIARAISKNYTQFFSNIVFNIKSTIELFGKPILIPFYFFIFIGGAFFVFEQSSKSATVLLLLIIGNIVPVLIFHPEPRYLLPSAVAILILCSVGMSALSNKNKVFSIIIISGINIIFYIRYAVIFSDITLSRCQ